MIIKYMQITLHYSLLLKQFFFLSSLALNTKTTLKTLVQTGAVLLQIFSLKRSANQKKAG